MNKVALAAALAIVVAAGGLAYFYLLPTSSVEMDFAGRHLTVELATTSSEWEKGLSGRASMAENSGMLFVFDHPSPWAFWMKGMEFPLDIIWFGVNRTVIYFVQDLQPCGSDDCQVYTPPSEALYVLEVNAGFVSLNNVTLGQSFTLHS